MQVDLAQFFAAFIDESGGEVRIAYDTVKNQTGEKALTIDIEDEGATLVFRLIDAKDLPDDLE